MFTKQEKLFLAAVRAKLPVIQNEDASINDEMIRRFYHDGYTVKETQDTCMCFEDFNPELAENIAIERMANIRARINARKKNA